MEYPLGKKDMNNRLIDSHGWQEVYVELSLLSMTVMPSPLRVTRELEKRSYIESD